MGRSHAYRAEVLHALYRAVAMVSMGHRTVDTNPFDYIRENVPDAANDAEALKAAETKWRDNVRPDEAIVALGALGYLSKAQAALISINFSQPVWRPAVAERLLEKMIFAGDED